MSEIVPPHFHKDKSIHELDVVPDDNYVSVVPDWQAPEGTEVSYLNAGTFRRYKMIDGVWRTIGATPIWTELAHGDLDGVGGINLTGLTGDTQKLYRIILRARFTTPEASLYLRFNGSSAAAYKYVNHRAGQNAGGASHVNSNGGSSAAQSELALLNGTYSDVFLELLIQAASGYKRFVHGTLIGDEDLDNYTGQQISGIWTNTANEITSIQITAGQNMIAGSEYWVDVRG